MDNLFDLLDKNLDDIKDLPSFKVPDTGVYKLSVSLAPKEINKKPAVEAAFVVREIVELEDSSIPEEERSKAGDKFNIAFILKDGDGNDSEMGWGRLKEFCQPFEAHFGEQNLRKLIQEHLATPVDITAQVKKVERKNEKDKYDARVSNVTVD